MIQIAKHIPQNFKTERIRLATAILNSTMNTVYTETDVSSFLDEADKYSNDTKLSLFGNSPADSILWNVSCFNYQ